MQEGPSGFYSFVSNLWSPAYHWLSAFFTPKRTAPTHQAAHHAAHAYGCYDSHTSRTTKSAGGGP